MEELKHFKSTYIGIFVAELRPLMPTHGASIKVEESMKDILCDFCKAASTPQSLGSKFRNREFKVGDIYVEWSRGFLLPYEWTPMPVLRKMFPFLTLTNSAEEPRCINATMRKGGEDVVNVPWVTHTEKRKDPNFQKTLHVKSKIEYRGKKNMGTRPADYEMILHRIIQSQKNLLKKGLSSSCLRKIVQCVEFSQLVSLQKSSFMGAAVHTATSVWTVAMEEARIKLCANMEAAPKNDDVIRESLIQIGCCVLEAVQEIQKEYVHTKPKKTNNAKEAIKPIVEESEADLEATDSNWEEPNKACEENEAADQR
eukprot:Platyproteum_vivax@DN3972_c0_g1_i3.p1